MPGYMYIFYTQIVDFYRLQQMDQLYYPIQPLDPLHLTHVTLDTTWLGVQPRYVRRMENGVARYLFVPL